MAASEENKAKLLQMRGERLKKMVDAGEARRSDESEPGVEQVMMRIEKLEGKIDFFNQVKSQVDEKLMRLSEQIGELRSSGVERERAIAKVTTDFDRIKDIFKEAEPDKMLKELDARDRKQTEFGIKIEKMDNVISAMNSELKEIRTLLGKIKSFENVLDVAKTVKEKVAQIEGNIRYTERLAGKTETIFSELSKQLPEIERQKERVKALEDLTKELIKNSDRLDVKLENIPTRDDVSKLDKRLAKVEEASSDAFIVELKKFEEKVKVLEASYEKFSRKDIDTKVELLEKSVDVLGAKLNDVDGSLENLAKIAKLRKKNAENLAKEKEEAMRSMKMLNAEYEAGRIGAGKYEDAFGGQTQLVAEIDAILDELSRNDRMSSKMVEMDADIKGVHGTLAGLSGTAEKIVQRIGSIESAFRERSERDRMHSASLEERLNALEGELNKVSLRVRFPAKTDASKHLKGDAAHVSTSSRKGHKSIRSTETQTPVTSAAVHGTALGETKTSEHMKAVSDAQTAVVEEQLKAAKKVASEEAQKPVIDSQQFFERELKRIRNAIDTLENQYQNGVISKETYEEVRARNREKLVKLRAQIVTA
jgi:chromosome segregation ATPase